MEASKMRCKNALLLAGLLFPMSLFGGPLRITTGKLADGFAQTLLEFEIRGVPEAMGIALKASGGAAVPCQEKARDSRSVRIVWLAPALRKGEEAVWEVDLVPKENQDSLPRVSVKEDGSEAVDVSIDGKQFTRLIWGAGERKPYLFPIIGPNGKMITRQFPMKKDVEGEEQDHPHQRSLWFTHGQVGGVDFWAEGKDTGTIRQVKIESMESGPVYGKIVTTNEWLAPSGKKLLDDRRSYTVYRLDGGETLLDLTITLTPAGEPVLFGDTKEGTFGIRLAESMREKQLTKGKPGGKVVSSRGQEGANAAWGKPAEWVDYSGPVAGDTVGVAILDHPKSFRHPTHWHVRDYGLFAANPFGYREFYRDDKSKDGNFTLEPGKSMEFRYRVYFHRGGAAEGKVAEVYRGFAAPPPLEPVGN